MQSNRFPKPSYPFNTYDDVLDMAPPTIVYDVKKGDTYLNNEIEESRTLKVDLRVLNKVAVAEFAKSSPGYAKYSSDRSKPIRLEIYHYQIDASLTRIGGYLGPIVHLLCFRIKQAASKQFNTAHSIKNWLKSSSSEVIYQTNLAHATLPGSGSLWFGGSKYLVV
ncbi:hypothetical protein HMPREF1544_00173 [Mucor circinelloides 1006PhL]|uniref:Uncharacterized protein n=1 Tax=Mucor circinelloides f. circinelloides (strain 1006PhL) TaxID=1220926 RepID=S2JT00_MUCC1|nr:hypothetical protein HMPREF1544_00173 [Mucor circinelloides 1006PhL]